MCATSEFSVAKAKQRGKEGVLKGVHTFTCIPAVLVGVERADPAVMVVMVMAELVAMAMAVAVAMVVMVVMVALVVAVVVVVVVVGGGGDGWWSLVMVVTSPRLTLENSNFPFCT